MTAIYKGDDIIDRSIFINFKIFLPLNIVLQYKKKLTLKKYLKVFYFLFFIIIINCIS